MRLLVTGGAGFIGSAVVRAVLSEDSSSLPAFVREIARVVNVDVLTSSASKETLEAFDSHKHVFVRADIRDLSLMESVFREYDPDAVMHLAAESHVDLSISRPLEFVETNVVGTCHLLEAARRHWVRKGRPDTFRFHHVSTDEVFGMLGSSGRFTEDSPYAPRNPYSASKAASDHMVQAWYETYGFPVIISNCSNNFGPYQFPEKLVPVVISSALAGRTIPVYGAGDQIRDWVFVEDHAAALLTVLAKGLVGRRYNIGAGNEVRNIDLVRMICATLDELRPSGGPSERHVVHVADRPGHDFRYAIDPSRIRNELGWSPKVSLSEGLVRTVEWYMNNEAWWRPLLQRRSMAAS